MRIAPLASSGAAGAWPGPGLGASRSRDPLADFTVDRRVLITSLLAIAVGAIGALVAQALLWLIAVITNLAYYQRWSATFVSPGANALGAWAVVIPVAGGLVIGQMARYGSEKIRGHGIPEALEAILLGRSRIEPKVALLKPISSALSIGTGGPFGAEGPIIMTGGAFGSLFAQRFPLSPGERKTLLVAGAAAGMAAVFATPVAALLLAVELLLFEWKPRSFIPVAVAVSTAGALRVLLLGPGPVFALAPHARLPLPDIALAVPVGIAAGLGSALLTAMVYGCEDLFAKLPVHWSWWPAIGGLAVGLGGLFDPRVLGVGYDSIQALLAGSIVGTAAVTLLAGKAVVWSVALGSGTSGGVLAPLLMMGAGLGVLEARWLPGGDAGLWALVGMASIMGGTMRCPLTALAFALELTYDLQALPALLAATAFSYLVTVLLMPRSILTEKVARRGHHLVREYSVDVLQLHRVREVMDVPPAAVPADLPIDVLARRLTGGDPVLAERQAAPIVDAHGTLVGIITRTDVMRALEQPAAGPRTVLEAGTATPVTCFPDETLRAAVHRMLTHGVGNLPVVSREDPGRVVGTLGRANVMSAHVRLMEDEEIGESA